MKKLFLLLLAANVAFASGFVNLGGGHPEGTAIKSTGEGSGLVLMSDGADGAAWGSAAGTGDVVGPAASVDSEMALYSGTTGKLLKRASGTGICKATSGVVSFASLVNADVSNSAAIAYSKLNLTGGIVNADVSSSAAIAYSKLSLLASIVDADIASGAAIAYSKLSLAGSIVNADIATGAAIAYSKLNLGSSIVNADIASGAAIAYSKLNLGTSIVNADIATGAAIARSKVAVGTADHVVINSGTGAFSSEAQLAVSRGGTNSGAALNNNRVMQSSGGAIVEAAAITSSKALCSDSNGIPVACSSGPSTTEMSYVTGLTSSAQTQISALKVEQLDGMVETPSNKTYVLRLKAKYAGTINEVSLKTASGTITAKLQIGGVDVTGCTGISVTSTASLTSCTAANTFASGDTLTLITSSNSSAADLQWSVKVTR